ncbi:hypothetical protein R3P38DRAFT_3376651 [Favolaschia claudopus]|uniref:Uncharacterized protein n=1 Tax=Favolaschia claudopus TaxID=2862362 RepID=A0AAV9ZEM4_9AGAR
MRAGFGFANDRAIAGAERRIHGVDETKAFEIMCGVEEAVATAQVDISAEPPRLPDDVANRAALWRSARAGIRKHAGEDLPCRRDGSSEEKVIGMLMLTTSRYSNQDCAGGWTANGCGFRRDVRRRIEQGIELIEGRFSGDGVDSCSVVLIYTFIIQSPLKITAKFLPDLDPSWILLSASVKLSDSRWFKLLDSRTRKAARKKIHGLWVAEIRTRTAHQSASTWSTECVRKPIDPYLTPDCEDHINMNTGFPLKRIMNVARHKSKQLLNCFYSTTRDPTVKYAHDPVVLDRKGEYLLKKREKIPSPSRPMVAVTRTRTVQHDPTGVGKSRTACGDNSPEIRGKANDSESTG